jgi:hypothetical protein
LMETVVEDKLDRFANDYYKFLALRYDLIPDLRVKVVHCRNHNWGINIPSRLREATENNPQFQHIVLTFCKQGGGRPSKDDKKLGLAAAGFTEEQAEYFSSHDMLLFVNFDQPVRIDGEIYIWNLLISHHVLHFVELLSSQRIIVEPPTVHNYEAQEALEHFNRFVAWVGLNETIDRYVPCK